GRRRVRRYRDDSERASVVTHDSVTVLHGTAAITEPAAEHVCARIIHGRDRRKGRRRSGGVSTKAPSRSTTERSCLNSGKGGSLGDASVSAAEYTQRHCQR